MRPETTLKRNSRFEKNLTLTAAKEIWGNVKCLNWCVSDLSERVYDLEKGVKA